MRMLLAAVSVFLGMSGVLGAAQSISPIEAKRMAEDTLLVMETVDKMVASDVTPEPVPNWIWTSVFDRSTGRLEGLWAQNYPRADSHPLAPYVLCSEAITILRSLKHYRLMAAKEPANKLWSQEAQKKEGEYFRDRKPRCAESIKTGKFPERRRTQ